MVYPASLLWAPLFTQICLLRISLKYAFNYTSLYQAFAKQSERFSIRYAVEYSQTQQARVEQSIVELVFYSLVREIIQAMEQRNFEYQIWIKQRLLLFRLNWPERHQIRTK